MENNKVIGMIALAAGLVVLGVTIGFGVTLKNDSVAAEEPAYQNPELLKVFATYDTNNNGEIDVFEYNTLKSFQGMPMTTEEEQDMFLEKYDLDGDASVYFSEFQCVEDPKCEGEDGIFLCGCRGLEGSRFPKQCESPQWSGNADTRIVKGGKGDELSGRIAALSFFYQAFAMGKLSDFTKNNCADALTTTIDTDDKVMKIKSLSFTQMNEIYQTTEDEFMNYCKWFAKPENQEPEDSECALSSFNKGDVETKNAADVKPNRVCKCLNLWIQKHAEVIGCGKKQFTNNRCSQLMRSLCTLTVGQNPSHITDMQKQWNLTLPINYMTQTGGPGNRCQWMAFMKTTNPYGQCVDHVCAGLNNGDCTLQKTGGRCVWYNKGDQGCRGVDGKIIPCETHGCYTSPCNNPSINSRAGCKAAWTFKDPVTNATMENKYKCVWCPKKVAMKKGLCPSDAKNITGGFGGCGGCTNAGDPDVITSGKGGPKCPDGKCDGLLKSKANCAGIRSCRKGSGLCMQNGFRNINTGKPCKGQSSTCKPCFCSFTNPYCWLGTYDKEMKSKYSPY